jgi:ribosome-dependent ATPase
LLQRLSPFFRQYSFPGCSCRYLSLTGTAWFAAKIFPSTYFQAISVGAFTKALGFAALWPNIAALALIAAIYFAVSVFLLQSRRPEQCGTAGTSSSLG